ncbi:MAG TPA: calcium-binding protein, partial [Ramlibacter sp.]
AGDNISGDSSAAGGGVDIVRTTVDYSAAGDQVEILVAATGTAAIDLTGNASANTLAGNDGINILDGGAGADVLAGGLGNDTYYLDNAADNISGESSAAGGGIDIVRTMVDYSAASDYVEVLVAAIGTAAIDLTGNTLINTLTGNDGANILNGGTGADILRGGLGNDSYVVDNAGDDIDGESSASAGGIDAVTSSITWSIASDYVENLTLAGTAAIDGTGNKLANTITGNAGANTILGAAGADVLTGGAGADKFAYAAAPESTLAAMDRITDFTRGTDKLDLSRLDGNAGLTGHQDFTFIGSKAFSANATGQLRFALESGKVMLYGSTDADATAEFAVHVAGATTLGSSDFVF